MKKYFIALSIMMLMLSALSITQHTRQAVPAQAEEISTDVSSAVSPERPLAASIRQTLITQALQEIPTWQWVTHTTALLTTISE